MDGVYEVEIEGLDAVYSATLCWLQVKASDNLDNVATKSRPIRLLPPEIRIECGADDGTDYIGIKSYIKYDEGSSTGENFAQYCWSENDTNTPLDTASWKDYVSENNIDIMEFTLPSGVNSKEVYLWVRAKNKKSDTGESFTYAKREFTRQNLSVSLYVYPTDQNFIGEKVESGITYYDFNYAITGLLELNRNTKKYQVRLRYQESSTEFSRIPTTWKYDEIFINPEFEYLPLPIKKTHNDNSARENDFIYAQAIDTVGNYVNNKDIRCRIDAPDITKLCIYNVLTGGSIGEKNVTYNYNNGIYQGYLGTVYGGIKYLIIDLPIGVKNISCLNKTWSSREENNKYTTNYNVIDEVTFTMTYYYDPDGSTSSYFDEYKWTTSPVRYNETDE